MVTVAFSVSGYCVIGSWKMARNPSARINRLTTAERTGRSTNRSVNFISLFLWSRVGVVLRHHAVIDLQRSTVLQLELPGGHYLVALFDTARNRGLVTSRSADRDEHLLRGQLAIRRFQCHEYGGPVRVVSDRCLRQGQKVLDGAREHGDV